MKSYIKYILLTIIITLLQLTDVKSQLVLDVTTLNNPAPGYMLFDYSFKPLFSLLDNYGYYVHESPTYRGNNHIRLLKNGNYSQFAYDKYYIYNNKLDLIDSIPNPTNYTLDYHDFISLNNGHYLVLLIADTIVDMSKYVEGGLTNAVIMNNILVETDRTGTVYWYWDSFANLDILDVTYDVNLKDRTIDFAHINSMSEDPNGNILISIRHYDEIALINKSGGFVWRLGGVECKNNQFTFINDLTNGFYGFSHQHTAEILSNGNILLFDNGNLKIPQYSRAVEYSMNLSTKTVTKVWEYVHPLNIYASSMGSTQRLFNGNTVINWSKGIITEVRNDNSVAFELTLPANSPVYRAQKVSSFMSYVSKNVSANGEYNFSEFDNLTGVKIVVENISSNGLTHLQKHYYPPHISEFNDSTFSTILPYRWVFTPDNKPIVISGKFKLDINTLQSNFDPTKISIYKRDVEGKGKFSELQSTYNSITKELVADFTGFGEFIVCTTKLPMTELKSPANDSYVSINGKMEWNKVIGASKYQIQVSLDKNFTASVINQFVTNSEFYVYSGLNFNQTYYWRVRAINQKDTSDWSEYFRLFTAISHPQLVYPINSYIGLKLNDSLRWNSVIGADSYQVQVATNPNFHFIILNKKDIKNLSSSVVGLSNNIEYSWRVRAFKGQDSSDWSEIRSFKTVIATPILSFPNNYDINIPDDVEFSWSFVEGASSYDIQISENIEFSFNTTSKYNVSNVNLLLNDLNLNSKYYWRVRAIRNTDSSDWSDIYEFNTLLTPPVLISPTLNQTNVYPEVNLMWTSDIEKPNYYLQVSDDFLFANLIIDTLIHDASNYFISELKPHTSYYWKVKLVNGEMESSWSETRKFTIGKGFELAGPKLSLPLNGSEGLSDGTLYWIKRLKANKYSIQISKSNDFNTLTVDERDIASNSYSFSNLTEGETYFWRVKGFTLYDSTQWSEVWSFSVVNPDTKISLKLPGNDDLQVPVKGELEWGSISDIDYYTLQVSKNELFTSYVIDEKITDNNKFNYTNFEKKTTYFWRVRYVRNGDISEWSDVWSFTTETAVLLNVPKITSPIHETIGVPINGIVSWEAVSGATEYQLSFSNQLNFSTVYFKQSSIKETKIEYSNLDYGTKYYLRVAAASNGSMSNWSVPSSFITELEPPVILHPNNEQEKYKSFGTIKWNISQNIHLYHLQISNDSEFNNVEIDVKDLEDLQYDYFLEDNTTYFCRVKSYNDSNFSRWSKTISFITDNATSVNEELFEVNVSIYPNPVIESAQFEINSPISGFGHIVLYDNNGNIVQNIYEGYFESGNNIINWSNVNLASGLYYYELHINKFFKTDKLIIIR